MISYIFWGIVAFIIWRIRKGKIKPAEVQNPNSDTPQYLPLQETIEPPRQSLLDVPNVSFVAIDFETANRHRSSACAIGMCKVEQGVVVDCYIKYLYPEPFEFESQNVYIHGIDETMTQNAPTITEDWGNICAFVGDLPVIAHNASFDRSVLEKSLEATGNQKSNWHIDCTLLQAKRLLPKRDNHKLSDLCKEFGIELMHHDAGSDAEACARLRLHLLKLDIPQITTSEVAIKRTIQPQSDALKGLTFVFTGEFDSYSRTEIEEIAQLNGAHVRNGVSGKTDYLVRGNIRESGKLTKAYELNTKIITEKAFFKLIALSQKIGTKTMPDKLTKYEALSKYNDYVEMTRNWYSAYQFDEDVFIQFGYAKSKKLEEAISFMESQNSYKTFKEDGFLYHKAIFNTTKIVDLRYIMFLTQGFKSRQIVVRDKIVSQPELSAALYYSSISDDKRAEHIGSSLSEEREYLENLFDNIKVAI